MIIHATSAGFILGSLQCPPHQREHPSGRRTEWLRVLVSALGKVCVVALDAAVPASAAALPRSVTSAVAATAGHPVTSRRLEQVTHDPANFQPTVPVAGALSACLEAANSGGVPKQRAFRHKRTRWVSAPIGVQTRHPDLSPVRCPARAQPESRRHPRSPRDPPRRLLPAASLPARPRALPRQPAVLC